MIIIILLSKSWTKKASLWHFKKEKPIVLPPAENRRKKKNQSNFWWRTITYYSQLEKRLLAQRIDIQRLVNLSSSLKVLLSAKHTTVAKKLFKRALNLAAKCQSLTMKDLHFAECLIAISWNVNCIGYHNYFPH